MSHYGFYGAAIRIVEYHAAGIYRENQRKGLTASRGMV